MAGWEVLAPKRALTVSKAVRWANNLGLAFLNSFILRLVFPAVAVFNHGNVSLSGYLDRMLRLFVVTSGMHRVYHSIVGDEANSNFGFSLPWWDRLFGTYRDQPRAGHEGMTIGIHSCRTTRQVSWLPGMLALPFMWKVSGYAINRKGWDPSNE